MSPDPPSRPPADVRAYWRAHLRTMAALLSLWAIGSYGLGIFLVKQLEGVRLGGFPLGFWFAQQGSIYLFVLLILVYALRMDRIDRRYGVD
jgi:putative solute:sodium symporter small subunit